jgi:catechol 2,3-dioxygenase
VEFVYDLPKEIWKDDINGALNYVKILPTEGAEALDDRTEGVPVFKTPAPAE